MRTFREFVWGRSYEPPAPHIQSLVNPTFNAVSHGLGSALDFVAQQHGSGQHPQIGQDRFGNITNPASDVFQAVNSEDKEELVNIPTDTLKEKSQYFLIKTTVLDGRGAKRGAIQKVASLSTVAEKIRDGSIDPGTIKQVLLGKGVDNFKNPTITFAFKFAKL